MCSSESNESLAICRAKASFPNYFKILRVDPVPFPLIAAYGPVYSSWRKSPGHVP